MGLAGGVNTYAYGMDNPLGVIDPLGLWGLSPFQSIRLTEPIVVIAIGAGIATGGLDVPILGAIGYVAGAYGAGEAFGEIYNMCRAH